MVVFVDIGEEEVDVIGVFDSFFVGDIFSFKVGGVVIEDVDVGGVDVDMREEVFLYEGVVGFWVVVWNVNVFVYVEGDDIFERDLFSFVSVVWLLIES